MDISHRDIRITHKELHMTLHHANYDLSAKNIIDRLGKTIVMAVPLAIGKPIGLINALYRMACADKSIQLTIITGLTLARPLLHNELEKRLVEPILNRILKDYEDPLYERDRLLQQVPENIKIIEFFLTPGIYLHNNYVQQNYISSKYTSAVHDSLRYSVNVFAQQVAHSTDSPDHYSLSCNSDLFLDMVKHLRLSITKGEKIAIVAEVNQNLPYMLGDAEINSEEFTDIIDTGSYRHLFVIPRDELTTHDHLIGLYTSCLIKDDSCLQIGIGKLSNAVAASLIMRHKHNAAYQGVLNKLSVQEKFGAILSSTGAINPFDQGLYSSTEMLSDEFMQLYQAGILKKRVYDHIGLQRLLNQHKITETITPAIIDILLAHQIISPQLTDQDIVFLKTFGIFNTDINFQNGQLILPSNEAIPADLNSTDNKQRIIKHCLGTKLQSGKILHGGFFVGTEDLYQQLRDLSADERKLFNMTSIKRTNSLLWSFELLQLQRQQARFVNSAMMVTLGGIVISDGLKGLQEFSGVGGQFDFVNMAQNLEDSRSIINVRSTRHSIDGVMSNIVWDYSNVTIPRYLRDIVVTEYGIADCRGKTDCELIKALLNITDSRFQHKLLKKAKKNGKVPQDYHIPELFRHNYPERIEPLIKDLQSQNFCLPYPFGSELTEEEKVIKRVLLYLKSCGKIKLLGLIIRSMFVFSADEKFNSYLLRMKLVRVTSVQEFIYKQLLKYMIRKYI